MYRTLHSSNPELNVNLNWNISESLLSNISMKFFIYSSTCSYSVVWHYRYSLLYRTAQSYFFLFRIFYCMRCEWREKFGHEFPYKIRFIFSSKVSDLIPFIFHLLYYALYNIHIFHFEYTPFQMVQRRKWATYTTSTNRTNINGISRIIENNKGLLSFTVS